MEILHLPRVVTSPQSHHPCLSLRTCLLLPSQRVALAPLLGRHAPLTRASPRCREQKPTPIRHSPYTDTRHRIHRAGAALRSTLPLDSLFSLHIRRAGNWLSWVGRDKHLVYAGFFFTGIGGRGGVAGAEVFLSRETRANCATSDLMGAWIGAQVMSRQASSVSSSIYKERKTRIWFRLFQTKRGRNHHFNSRDFQSKIVALSYFIKIRFCIQSGKNWPFNKIT